MQEMRTDSLFDRHIVKERLGSRLLLGYVAASILLSPARVMTGADAHLAPSQGVAGNAATIPHARKRLIVIGLEAIRIGAAIGLADSLLYGLAVAQFGGRMSFTLLGMLMLVCLLALCVLRCCEFEDDKGSGT